VAPAAKVFISGEVRNPGAFAHRPGMTVRELVGLAGGYSEDGSARGLRLARKVDGRSQERKAKLDDPVEPGDSVVVKARLF
jgi:protein involved in polysaccharide export with SLBB domain